MPMRAPGQSIADARKKANEFVREKFALAWKYKAQGDKERSLYEFGLALHTLQDSTSPSHFNFPVWAGLDKTPWLALGAHGGPERNYPGDDSDLYRITQQAYQSYLSGKLPDGILFSAQYTRNGILYDQNDKPVGKFMEEKDRIMQEEIKRRGWDRKAP